MAQGYRVTNPPREYDPIWIEQELQRISAALEYLEVPRVRITESNVVPDRPRKGDIARADGTNWNPGSGAGVYEYNGSTWTKL